MRKTLNAAFCVFVALLIATLMTVSLTQGRYIKEEQSGSDFSGSLEYIVSEQVEISSVDEFFSAVENGYSNIKIADEVDNPIIITGNVSDVNSDLTIDLNGHELQRNNRNPMLNVTAGVRLTIIDTSQSKTGSFYNPVGSVLQISGGTLTVAAGLFESGPRNGQSLTGQSTMYPSEYATQSGNGWQTASGATISGAVSTTLFSKTDNSNYDGGTTTNMPLIIPQVMATGTPSEGQSLPAHTVNGNFFFENQSTVAGHTFGASTYLYFTIEGDNYGRIAANDGSADFFYRYYVSRSYANGTITYRLSTSESDANRALVTVYGYNNVTTVSQDNPYAAIKMTGGNLYTRGGNYVSYFGVPNTYCVQASGGYMAVENGVGSFQAQGEGVCVGISYEAVSQDNYLRVASGDFYSQIGDTIALSGGLMRVYGDVAFHKDAQGSALSDNGAAIDMTGGELYITSTTSQISFDVVGDYTDGVRSSGGILQIDGKEGLTVNFNLTGNNVHGVRSAHSADGATQGILAVAHASFAVRGSNAYGIHSSGGNISVGNANISVGQSGASNVYGVYSESGVVSTENCIVTVTGDYARGIFSAATDSNSSVNCIGTTQIDVTGQYAAGILTTGGTVNIDGVFGSKIEGSVNNLLSSTAISSEGGHINVRGTSTTITTDGLGITSRSASGAAQISIETAQFSLTATQGTAIYISGGSLSIGQNTTAYIESTINDNFSWVTPPDGDGQQSGGSTSTNKYNGVFIEGGSLSAQGVFNVTHKGVENQLTSNGSTLAFDAFVVRSYAVRAEGSDTTTVTIAKGTITNSVGGGVYVGGGTVTLGQQGTTDLTVSATGNSGSVATGQYSNWAYHLYADGGNAVEVNGGTINILGGSFSAARGNGILVSGGTSTVTGGTFVGNSTNSDTGPGAHYGFKALHSGSAVFHGGSFSGNNGGAFTMGSSDDSFVSVTVLAGSFATQQGGGNNAFTVFERSNVVFGQQGKTSDISVTGVACALAVNKAATAAATITIHSGTFTANDGGSNGNTKGIWFNNAMAKLTVTGGTFVGNNNINGNNWVAGLDVETSLNSTVGGIDIQGGNFHATSAYHANRYGINLRGSVSVTGGLKISGGNIGNSSARYGLWYNTSAATNDGVQISGGTFEGTNAALRLEANPWQTGNTWNVCISGGTFEVQNPSSNYRPISYNTSNTIGYQSLFASHSNGAAVDRYSFKVHYSDGTATTVTASTSGWDNSSNVWTVQQNGNAYATKLEVGNSMT